MLKVAFFGSNDNSLINKYKGDIISLIECLFQVDKEIVIINGGYQGLILAINEIARSLVNPNANEKLFIQGILFDGYSKDQNFSDSNKANELSDSIISTSSIGLRVQSMLDIPDVFFAFPGRTGTFHEILQAVEHTRYGMDFNDKINFKRLFIHSYWRDVLESMKTLHLVSEDLYNEVNQQIFSFTGKKERKKESLIYKLNELKSFKSYYSINRRERYNKIKGNNAKYLIRPYLHDSNIDIEYQELITMINSEIQGEYFKANSNCVIGLDIVIKNGTKIIKLETIGTKRYMKVLEEFLDNYKSILSNYNESMFEWFNLDNINSEKSNELFFHDHKSNTDFQGSQDSSIDDWIVFLENNKLGKSLLWIENSFLEKFHVSAFLILDLYVTTELENKLNIIINQHLLKATFEKYAKELLDELKEKQRDIQRQAIRAAISQVMARNMSHNLGSHVVPYFISKYFEPRKIYTTFFNFSSTTTELEEKAKKAAREITIEVNKYNRYIQERMELIATVSTTFPHYLKTEANIEEICESFKDTKIVFNGIVDGSLDIVFKETSKEQFHLPGGQIGNQLMFLFIEGIARNCKKHSALRKDRFGNDKFIDLSFKISDYDSNYFQLEIIDMLGKANVNRSFETLSQIRGHLYSSILDNNELRKGGWGILEFKIAAALLIDAPLEYIDSFQQDIKPIEINGIKYPPIIEVGFYDDDLNLVKEGVALDKKSRNIGYKIHVLKPKLYFVDSDEWSAKLECLTDKSTIVKRKVFSLNEACDFYFGNNIQSRKSNYRILHDFSIDEVTREKFKEAVWQKWIAKSYPDFYKISFENVGEDTTDFDGSGKFIFDDHGKWFAKNIAEKMADSFAPGFYQPYNNNSSLVRLLQKDDEVTKFKLKEAVAIGISIFDERIQEEVKLKDHENIPGIKLIYIFSRMKIFIPDYTEKGDTMHLQNYIDKDAESKLEFDKHPLLNIIKERFQTHKDKYVLIHHTIFEKIAKEVTNNHSNSQKSLNTLYEKIYSTYNLQSQHLIIISGLGLPSNLPDQCYFLNLVTVQNLLLVMKSKFHLVQALHSLRPIKK